MILRLRAEEAEEVRRALFSERAGVLRKLGFSTGLGGHEAGLELCRRKWAIDEVLRQLEHPDGPAPVLQLVPRTAMERVARIA